MRAILIGGPRHLQEFEVPSAPPPQWLVPKPEPFTKPLTISEDPFSVAKPYFQTVRYNRQAMPLAGYWIYVCEEA